MGKILILEDEDSVNRGIFFSLQKAGHAVCACHTIQEARTRALSFGPEIIICDINLPDGSGLDFIMWYKKLRDVYIICLTALSQEMEQVLGYEAGADDYITKPFSLMALRARVENIRKRALRQPGQIYEEAGYRFDFEKLDFRVNGIETSLSASEQKLLRLFVTHPGQTLPRGMLLESIWSDGMDYVDENALSVTVSRLRRKLEIKDRQSPISTVYGIGYVWKYMEEGK